MTEDSASDFALARNAVHIWSVRTDVVSSEVEALRPFLSQDEQARAAEFRFAHLEKDWIVARGVLRLLLGRYLNVAPDALAFHYGLKGKPFLTMPEGLQFNASHSGSLAAFAFAYGCGLGIDVEQIQPLPDLHQVAERFFCAEEVSELRSLPVDEQTDAFFLCWTRKEAYIKAVGEGLSCPLNAFRVSLRPGELASFVHIGFSGQLARHWSLHNVDFGPSFAGALAYKEAPRHLTVRRVELARLLEFAHKKTG